MQFHHQELHLELYHLAPSLLQRSFSRKRQRQTWCLWGREDAGTSYEMELFYLHHQQEGESILGRRRCGGCGRLSRLTFQQSPFHKQALPQCIRWSLQWTPAKNVTLLRKKCTRFSKAANQTSNCNLMANKRVAFLNSISDYSFGWEQVCILNESIKAFDLLSGHKFAFNGTTEDSASDPYQNRNGCATIPNVIAWCYCL